MDTDICQSWTKEQIRGIEKSISAVIDNNNRDMIRRTVKLNRAITIPGLIGEEKTDLDKFQTMADYISHRRIEIANKFVDMERKVDSRGSAALEMATRKINQELKDIRTEQGRDHGALKKQFDCFSHSMNIDTNKSFQDVNTKLIALDRQFE